MKSVLHVGCGNEDLPPDFVKCDETRLDINPKMRVDVVADIAHLPEDLGPFDAVYACHCLEHLYEYDVDPALSGFLRVLGPGGVAIIRVPDLEDVKPTDDFVYDSPGGPITGHDMYYGWGRYVAAYPYMGHHCGFTQARLTAALERNGFVEIQVSRAFFELIAIGRKAAA